MICAMMATKTDVSDVSCIELTPDFNQTPYGGQAFDVQVRGGLDTALLISVVF